MSTYLFIVLPIMLIFSAAVTAMGAALVTLVLTLKRNRPRNAQREAVSDVADAPEPTLPIEDEGSIASAFAEMPVVGETTEEAEKYIEQEPPAFEAPKYMPINASEEAPVEDEAEPGPEPVVEPAMSAEVEQDVTEEPPAEEAGSDEIAARDSGLEKKLISLPASFFVAKDVTLALRQRVSYKGKWLKYADLPYVVVGPRRIHLVFDSERSGSGRRIEEEIDRDLHLTARFLKLKLEADFRICAWQVREGKAGPKDPWRFATADNIVDAIRRFEKSPLGKSKESTSEHFSDIVQVLRACQPQDMRPLQLVV